jgi:hypothetical protein
MMKTLSKKKFAVVSKRRSRNMAVKKLAMTIMMPVGGSHAENVLGRENVPSVSKVRRTHSR